MIKKRDWGSMTLKDQLSISEKTYLLLKEAILQGQLQLGEKLYEKDLAEKVGVSRTPVREALKQLAMEELIFVEPRKYYVVRGLTLDEVNEIVTIRSLLEPYAVKQVAPILDDDDIKELKKCVELGYVYLEMKDIEGLSEINSRFHDVFAKRKQSRITRIISTLRDYIYFLRTKSLSRPERAMETVREHEKIIESIQEKDYDKVEFLIRQHIEHGRLFIIEDFKKRI